MVQKAKGYHNFKSQAKSSEFHKYAGETKIQKEEVTNGKYINDKNNKATITF